MVATDVDQIDVVTLQARYDGGKILVALVVGLKHLFGDASLVERLFGLVGKAFAVAGLVIEDRDVLVLVVLRDVCAGNAALLIVAAANACHVPEAPVSELGGGGSGCNLQHVAVGIGFGGRNRRRRAVMTRNERDLGAGEFFRDRARLLGIAGIVADFQLQLLAEHAACGIEVGHGLFGAI